jgi:hypothetical protein
MRTYRRGLLAVAAAAAALLPSALPAHAANGANFGGGAVTINASFTNPGGLPLFNGGCASVTFNLTGGDAVGVVANTVETTFEGIIPLSGSGNDSCAFLDREVIGNITLNAFTVNSGLTNSSVSCPAGLSGTYSRVGTHVQVDVHSPAGFDCVLNGWASGPFHFISDGEFAPTSGDGVLNHVMSGTYAGAFAIAD